MAHGVGLWRSVTADERANACSRGCERVSHGCCRRKDDDGGTGSALKKLGVHLSSIGNRFGPASEVTVVGQDGCRVGLVGCIHVGGHVAHVEAS